MKEYILRVIDSEKKVPGKNGVEKTVFTFHYEYKDKSIVKDKHILNWIETLHIPPKWKDVNIYFDSRSIRGNIKEFNQSCCGRDDKNRLQCLYSKSYIQKSTLNKFKELAIFSKYIYKIFNQIEKDLDTYDCSKNSIIALALRIMWVCSFRMGTIKYEIHNKTYGITTLLHKHLTHKKNNTLGSYVQIKFVGKKGVINESSVNNPDILKYIKILSKNETDLHISDNKHVLMYKQLIDSDDINKKEYEWIHLSHLDINNYLSKFHHTITSTCFRTFRANEYFVNTIKQLVEDFPKLDSKTIVKKGLIAVSEQLHNTPAICKKNYVDPHLYAKAEINPKNIHKEFAGVDIFGKLSNYFIKEYKISKNDLSDMDIKEDNE